MAQRSLPVALFLLIVAACSLGTAEARFRPLSFVREKLYLVENLPFFLDDDDEDETFSHKVLPTVSSAMTTLYGTALVLGSKNAPGQIHFITMMRATGFDKLEKALKAARQNFRQAKRSAVWNAPSFVMAARSIGKMQERVQATRDQVAMTRQAHEDGILTKKEARRLQKAQKRIIRNLQRDMKRLVEAGSSIQTFIRVLDVDEIVDIIKGFLFQLMAVLASGHNDNRIGRFISRWCLTLNLGSLFLETNHRLDYPTSRILLTGRLSKVAKKKTKSIHNLARIIVYSLSGYLSFGQTDLARRLNSACIASSIVVRGVRSLANTLWDKKDKTEGSIWKFISLQLASKPGGMLLFTLSTIGFLMQDKNVELPYWLQKPLVQAEEVIKKVAVVMDKVF